MEAFALYLLKSVTWLSGFALVFILFLRNERFFRLNRLFLISGILTSFFFPLISIHYTVVLPVVKSLQVENAVAGGIQGSASAGLPDIKFILTLIYAAGVLFVLSLIIKQGISLIRVIKKSEVISLPSAKLIKSADYTSAFSFFSYVFVNPSVTDIEAREIMNHELVHIRQKHWFDLLLIEMLCMLQWFNPLVWIYVRFIRQNHEYLADEVALQRTSDPAIYRAALLNQIVGAPVVSLANSFNYSLNKKRFYMMKNIMTSPYRKMKVLLILPVFALVLYSFAKPDYKYKIIDGNPAGSGSAATQVQHEVTGTVVQKDGTPLPAANIVLQSTTIGTITDLNGAFKLVNVPDDGALVVSFMGFKPKVIKADFKAPMKIVMLRDTIKYSDMKIGTPPPPPPPPPVSTIVNEDGTVPLYVVDGVIKTQAEVEKIDHNAIESVSIWKNKTATEKYGDKGKNGVVEITMKKVIKGSSNQLPGVPPPPPPPPPSSGLSEKAGEKPLLVIDGKISDVDIDKIDPETIFSMNILKDKSPSDKPATDKYGNKGKNGVIEITTKGDIGKALVVIDGVIKDKEGLSKINTDDIKSMNVLKSESAVKKYGDKGKDGVIEVTTFKEGEKRPEPKVAKSLPGEEPFVVVEESPEFNGGNNAMVAYINNNLKYPAEAVKGKITGKVTVSFVVTKTGKVKDVAVVKPVNPALDAEAVRVISSMPDWKPGKQGGKGVDVLFRVPVEFKLN